MQMLRKYLLSISVFVIFVSVVTWIISILNSPTPLPANAKVILFFTALASVTSVAANFNDLLQLAQAIFGADSDSEELIQRVSELEDQLQKLLEQARLAPDQFIRFNEMPKIQEEIRQAITATLNELQGAEKELGRSDAPKELMERAQAALIANQWKDAARYLTSYLVLERKDWFAHHLRGVAYANLRLGDESNREALISYGNAIALMPEDVADTSRTSIHYQRGAMFKRLNRLDEAESELLLAQKWATHEYTQKDIAYNLACVYAMQRKKQAMLLQLERIKSDAFWRSVVWSRAGSYFANYADDPDFVRLLE